MASITLTCALLALLIGCLLPSGASAWSQGDIVPVSVWIRINKTNPNVATPIPNDFCPRFALNKIVQVPSIDYGSTESDVALKFEIGRGINRGTKWLALKQLPSPTNGLTAQKHLTMVVFKFGFQVGAFGRFTSFKALASYSDKPHETITLKYEWDEHRSYNPHVALTVVSVVSVVAMVFLAHRITADSLATIMKKGVTVVRDRKD